MCVAETSHLGPLKKLVLIDRKKPKHVLSEDTGCPVKENLGVRSWRVNVKQGCFILPQSLGSKLQVHSRVISSVKKPAPD